MATAIERNFDTMRYRMYFAKIPKFSQQEKETRISAVLKEMLLIGTPNNISFVKNNLT